MIDKGTHEFRFLTRLSTHKTDELAANPDVNLAFSDPGPATSSPSPGQAYLTQDRKLIESALERRKPRPISTAARRSRHRA